MYTYRARHTSKEIPILYEIQADTTPKIVSKIIKQYPEQNASSSELYYGSYKESIHYGKISHTIHLLTKVKFGFSIIKQE